ncbi:MAG: membrane protein insertion efficiency factor YidD [Ruminiclostridium sp.]|nr:membrane protein insertion efficiency factor YidD [Ruminiclostridium sp.]
MIKKILLWLIRAYQRVLSPLKGTGSCRFYPTCSAYAYDAIEIYGPLKGTFLAIKRVFKCHPFHPGGYDPVKREGE